MEDINYNTHILTKGKEKVTFTIPDIRKYSCRIHLQQGDVITIGSFGYEYTQTIYKYFLRRGFMAVNKQGE